MTYTEIKTKNKSRYFYRVKSIRQGKKVSKKRIYLGANLSKQELAGKESEADSKLNQKSRNKQDELNKSLPKIKKILKQNNIKKAGIFGSYAVGKQKKNSDIDILIQPTKNMGFGFAGLEKQLEKSLNRKVDLVSYKGISPYLKKKILKQEKRII